MEPVVSSTIITSLLPIDIDALPTPVVPVKRVARGLLLHRGVTDERRTVRVVVLELQERRADVIQTIRRNGEHLLAAVRDAMRWIHDGVAAVAGGGFRGPFVVASGGAGTTALVAQRLAELRERHPELVPHIVSPRVGRTSWPSMLRSVLLPDPFGPSTTVTRPASTA